MGGRILGQSRWRWPVAAFAALGLVAAAGQADEPVEQATPTVVEINASEFRFEPRALVLPAGPLAVVVRNVGVVEHDLAIEDPQRRTVAQTGVLAPGEAGRLLVTLDEGRYAIVCTLPGHREARMVGTLTLSPAQEPAGAG